jgi:hypothetical protein
VAVTDLKALIWSLSTWAQLAFVQELDGLEIIAKLLKASEDSVVLTKCLQSVKCLGSSQSDMVDYFIQTGAASEVVKLSR